MKNLNNKLKIILIIALTSILVGGLSSYATYNYLAKDISYTKSNGTIVSVENALNELYNFPFKNLVFLDRKITADDINLELDYTSDFNGKILIIITHVKRPNFK